MTEFIVRDWNAVTIEYACFTAKRVANGVNYTVGVHVFKLALLVATGTGMGGGGGGVKRRSAISTVECFLLNVFSLTKTQISQASNRSTVIGSCTTQIVKLYIRPVHCNLESSSNIHDACVLLKSPGRRDCGTTTLRYARTVSIPLRALFVCRCWPRCYQSTTPAC